MSFLPTSACTAPSDNREEISGEFEDDFLCFTARGCGVSATRNYSHIVMVGMQRQQQ